MKKWPLFLSLCFCACLLAGCSANSASGTGTSDHTAPAAEGGGNAAPTGEDGADGYGWPVTTICRIVDGAESGELLLAERDSGAIYCLNAADVGQITIDGGSGSVEEMGNGMMVQVVHDGTILETWPARFANVKALYPAVRDEEDGAYDFDDRCALYLRVLEDLWAVDPGLNSGDLTYIGVDLTKTSLSGSERAAVAWAFAGKHGAEVVEGTYEELVEQGYITGEPLDDSAPDGPKFWQWTDGCLFSITESDEPVIFNQMDRGLPANMVSFDAQKWRSSLGAYYFVGCTAAQSADGHWGDYTVGSEAIS